MKMDGRIRVKSDGRYGRLYADMKNAVVGDFHELFFVCACIGYKERKRKPIDRSHSDRDRFWSSTILPREWACYYAMVLADNEMDFTCIQDDQAVINTAEEYANAGMAILIERFLSDYLINADTEPQLDSAASRELPKNFLHHIFEQVDATVDYAP
jgi:hypothetical protein